MKRSFRWMITGVVGLVLIIGGIILTLSTPNLISAGVKVSASVPTGQSQAVNPQAGNSPLSFFPFISKIIIPTPTSSPAPTPTNPPPTPTQPPSGGGLAVFALGAGGADVIPHQIVRTADDRLYVFAYKGDGSAQLNAYWTGSAGLPSSGANFNGSHQLTNSSNILSVDPVYDGGHIIHVLINDLSGKIKDLPFDTVTNTYKAEKTLDTSGGTVVGYYVGTSGLSGLFDADGKMHVAFWSNSNHILYRSYTYNISTDTLTLVDGPTQLDVDGKANHPALAVSPLNGNVTVAWVSEATSPAKILAKTRVAGSWGAIEPVSSAAVWTSSASGINIDQGPSLIISSDGKRHLAYIENWGQGTLPYGKVHYVVNSGSGWIDQDTGFYSHDPAVAINGAGEVKIIGHGFDLNQVCTSIDDMCVYPLSSSGSWGAPSFLFKHVQGQTSFDSSPSVKWSVAGFNRPGTIELIFAEVFTGYTNSTLYYARLN